MTNAQDSAAQPVPYPWRLRRSLSTKSTRAHEARHRIQAGAEAIAAAISYGLVHSLEGAIERNRTRGWADDALQTFRLESDDEVRAAWAILERRSRER